MFYLDNNTTKVENKNKINFLYYGICYAEFYVHTRWHYAAAVNTF